MDLHLLGNAKNYVPVIFDLGLDIYKDVNFTIHCNLNIEEPDFFFNKDKYQYKLVSKEDTPSLSNKKLLFGVVGAKAKNILLKEFQSCHINKNQFVNLIHPDAIISQSSKCNKGLILEPLSVVSSQTELGFGVIIKRNVSVGHHCKVGDFVEISPGVTICSNVEIGDNSIIGAGAVIRDQVKVGKNSIVGMGSVVTKDVQDNCVVVGAPAKIVRRLDPN